MTPCTCGGGDECAPPLPMPTRCELCGEIDCPICDDCGGPACACASLHRPCPVPGCCGSMSAKPGVARCRRCGHEEGPAAEARRARENMPTTCHRCGRTFPRCATLDIKLRGLRVCQDCAREPDEEDDDVGF